MRRGPCRGFIHRSHAGEIIARKKVNGPNVARQSGNRRDETEPDDSRKNRVFPRVLMLCFVKLNLKTNQRLVPKKSLIDTIPTTRRKTPITVLVRSKFCAPMNSNGTARAQCRKERRRKNTVCNVGHPNGKGSRARRCEGDRPIKKDKH